MTIEQLLCPEVLMWESNFRKHLNESHIEMTNEEIADEFDKWLVENEDKINKSVEDNIEHINETINRNLKKVNEGIFDDDAFDDDEDDEDDGGKDDDEEEPISVTKNEKIDEDEPEEKSKLTGAVKLTDNKSSKFNIFGFINDFYDEVNELHINNESHFAIMRKLDVSAITNMTALFAFTNLPNLDLSTWNTGLVKHMEGMFYKSTFNNDSICSWDVSSCADFKNMFLFSPFNQSLKKWTPKWIEKKFRNPDGSTETKTVRADLPIIGGTEDENRNITKTYRRSFFKSVRDEEAAENGIKENKINENMIHIVDFETFINEGKFKDFIDKGIKKVKDIFNSITMKFGNFIASFKENGEMYPAISAYTSLNTAASGAVKGVTAFCDVKNEYLESTVTGNASIVESPEYYGIIKKDSIEYRNYTTFASMINEHYEKYGDTGMFQMVNEDNFKRVGFSAESGGVVARDIDSDDLKEILEDVIENVPANKGDKHGGAVFIWGAPGIGKSSIPKDIVKQWNKHKGDEFHKKALMVVECGDLTIDGFSLPIPIEKSISEYLDERPKLNDIIKSSGVSTETLEKIKRNMHKVSVEAPKTWLPAFKMTSNQDEVNILNDIANGHLEIKSTNGRLETNETTEGGILLFDEFFRANEEVFKILMQLLLNRTYSGYMLGNKWGLLCCSNRPNDDEEVSRGFEKTGAVVGTRMLAGTYNFIPSFNDWKKWAMSEGGFDEITLEFLMFDKDNKGEYTNWHTIRPEEYSSRGKTAWPTPRTWSALMNELNLYMENHGYSSILKIPENKIHRIADGIIGKDMSSKYVAFLKAHTNNIAVETDEVLNNPEYEIPSDSKCPNVVRQLENSIKIKYSADELPTLDQMMNLFNKLNATYSGTKDNFVKMLHVNLIKHFNVMVDKNNRLTLKDYLQAVDSRYKLDKADLK